MGKGHDRTGATGVWSVRRLSGDWRSDASAAADDHDGTCHFRLAWLGAALIPTSDHFLHSCKQTNRHLSWENSSSVTSVISRSNERCQFIFASCFHISFQKLSSVTFLEQFQTLTSLSVWSEFFFSFLNPLNNRSFERAIKVILH